MKKYLFYIVALIAAACILDGCKKDELQEEPGPPPEIYVRTPKVYPGKGGAFSLLYSIENPREGVKPELSSGESWIRDLAAGEGRITFTLDQNPSSTESRTFLHRVKEREHRHLIQRGGTGQRGNHPGRHGPGCNHSQGAGSLWL